MLKRISGPSNLIPAPKTASTALSNGTVVKFSGSTGFLVQGAAADTIVLGVIQQTIASTDSDYANNTPVLIDTFEPSQVWECDVTNGGAVPGTLAVTSIGQYFKIDAAATPASGSIDSNTGSTTPNSSGTNWVCLGFISVSKGLFRLLPVTAV